MEVFECFMKGGCNYEKDYYNNFIDMWGKV